MAARKRSDAAGVGGVTQLARLLDQRGMRGRGRRSQLSRWLRAHQDAFRALLADKQPGWDDLATALATLGLRDGDGKPPTGERARKAWWAVRRAKATTRASPDSPATPPPLPRDEIAPAAQAIPAPGAAAAARPRMRLDLRPATPLTGEPAAQTLPAARSAVPDSAVAGPAQPDGGAAEQIRRLIEQMNASKVPLPKVVP